MTEVVVIPDTDETSEETTEAITEVVEELTDTITEVVEELTDAIEEVAESSGEATVTEAEVDRILEVERRLNALESRPWPVDTQTVATIAEAAAEEEVAEVVEALVEAMPEESADDEVTIVEPDIDQEPKGNWFTRIW